MEPISNNSNTPIQSDTNILPTQSPIQPSSTPNRPALFKKLLIITIVIFLLLASSAVGYYFVSNINNDSTIEDPKVTSTPIIAPPSPTHSPEGVTIPKDEKTCVELGGKWQNTNTVSNPFFCNLPTTDGGKTCTDSSQCESYCQARSGLFKTTGQCYEWKAAACMKEVLNGSPQVEWCY